LSGDDDLRTSRVEALAVAAQLPRGRVLTVPHVAHSVLGTSRCARRALAAFLRDRPVRDCQTPRRREIPTQPLAPARMSDVPGTPGLPPRIGRTLTAVQLTFSYLSWQSLEAFVTAIAGGGGGGRGSTFGFGGLRSGSLGSDASGAMLLRDYCYVPGVTVSGEIGVRTRTDRVTVAGAAGVRGTLRVGSDWIAGTLGGRSVRARVLTPLTVGSVWRRDAGRVAAAAATAGAERGAADVPWTRDPVVPPAPDRLSLSAR
jgi:hypothetical protein